MASKRKDNDLSASDSDLQILLTRYMNHLIEWLIRNGWAGWDPYDVYDNPFGIWMMQRNNLLQRIVSALVVRLQLVFPVIIRRLLKVAPQINPKAMGLFAASFLELERVEGQPRLINDIAIYDICFDWLDKNRIEQYGGCGWGYPFDWMSRILIPGNTPTVVNSAIIGDAYWLLYTYHDDEDALKRCESICEFIVKGLNRSTEKKDGSFCFSYTPIDEFQVHNANLFGAEFLIRIGKEVGRQEWIDLGLSAGRFSLSEIREDGTLNYWSHEQSRGRLQQDTYHSGFEIRALDGIACLTGVKEFRQAADDYFSTWLRDFFSKDGIPCLARGQTDVIEVHSCAEALLCAGRMFASGNFSHELLLKHVKGILSAAAKLWVKKEPDRGYFASRVYKQLGFEIKADIPYIRWGEAWMLRALAVVQTFIKPGGTQS